MALIAYNSVLIAALPLLVSLLLWHVLVTGRFKDTWKSHLTLQMPATGKNPVLWLHAASVGETRAIEGLVRRIKAARPDVELLVTNMTCTGHDLARRLEIGDAHGFLPFDLPGLPSRFVERVRPSALVLVETEIWPNLLASCGGRRIPVVIVNGRLSPRHEPTYRRLAALYRQFLSPVGTFLMQGEEDARRLLAIGVAPSRVSVAGDLKIDLALERASQVDPAAVRRSLGLGAGPVIVAGSIHAGEDRPLVDAFSRLRTEFPQIEMVVAPRHMCDVPQMAAHLAARGIGYRLRSDGSPPAHRRPQPVLVLDTIGELASAYAAARMAFIGGSLVPKGGHSLFEPAAMGCPIMIGPHDENFSEESQKLRQRGGAVRVDGEEAIVAAARRWLSSEEEARKASEEARKGLQELAGATDRVVAVLLSIVDRQPATAC